MKENEEKNKGLHILILIIGIVLYIAIILLTGPLSTESLRPYSGIFAQFQVAFSVIMIITNKKRGMIAACILNILGAATALMAYLRSGQVSVLPGVFIPIITIFTLSIIYLNITRNYAMRQELNEQYERIMDTNRILQEKDEALRAFAYTDRMTGLPNMPYFRDQIEEAIRLQMAFSIIYMDIDHFKIINDTFGPKVGDTVLTIYAERIASYCGQKYICARTSGDDFGIILTGEQTEADILNIIEQFRRLFGEPVNIQGASLSSTVSYGIVTYPRDGMDVETLLDNAVMAVYTAKANGKDRPCFFSQA